MTLRNGRYLKRPIKTSGGETTPGALVLLAIVLMLAWLLWSGIYKPMIVVLGMFSVLLTVFLAHRVNFFSHTSGLLQLLVRLPGYWLWLLKEIVVSSLEVARLVWSPTLRISPTMISLEKFDAEEMSQVILANSITLSPGTVTVDIDEGIVQVHCLSEAGARALLEGDLVQRVIRLKANRV